MHPSIHARTTPDKVAYRMAASGECVTYRALDDASNRVAQLLRAQGLGPGDHIALMLENHPRYFELCWGAQRAGMVYTPISSRLTASEAAYIVNDSGAALFVTSFALRTVAAQLLDHMPGVAARLMVDGAIDGYDNFEHTLRTFPAQPVNDQTAGCDMLYSSGTTGRPKGVLIGVPSPAIDAPHPMVELCSKLFGFDERAVYLSPAPLYHAAPLRFCMTVMRLGGTAIVMERFEASEYLRMVQAHAVTHTQLVPTMFVRLLQLPPTLGDIGYVDDEGYLYLTDRQANMIISGGVNIYPQECENLLATHPKVYDVAVFGVPNEEFGEEVKAVVEPHDMRDAGPALAAELMAFCRQHLSPIKCPRSVDFEAALPREPTGKLHKRLLRERYWAGRGGNTPRRT